MTYEVTMRQALPGQDPCPIDDMTGCPQEMVAVAIPSAAFGVIRAAAMEQACEDALNLRSTDPRNEDYAYFTSPVIRPHDGEEVCEILVHPMEGLEYPVELLRGYRDNSPFTIEDEDPWVAKTLQEMRQDTAQEIIDLLLDGEGKYISRGIDDKPRHGHWRRWGR